MDDKSRSKLLHAHHAQPATPSSQPPTDKPPAPQPPTQNQNSTLTPRQNTDTPEPDVANKTEEEIAKMAFYLQLKTACNFMCITEMQIEQALILANAAGEYKQANLLAALLVQVQTCGLAMVALVRQERHEKQNNEAGKEGER